jgi:hypothetical protein
MFKVINILLKKYYVITGNAQELSTLLSWSHIPSDSPYQATCKKKCDTLRRNKSILESLRYMKIAALWVIKPCGYEAAQYFGGTYRIHLQSQNIIHSRK